MNDNELVALKLTVEEWRRLFDETDEESQVFSAVLLRSIDNLERQLDEITKAGDAKEKT